MKNIKVSIVCIAYNQEGYIAETLESFVSQKANFNFEVIVADDKSTDNTPQIINEYAKKYPDIIKPILRKKNLGPQANFVDALKHAKGEYIALCEGDDYWTSPKKIQKQADFLDTNGSYNLVFHPVRIFFENKEEEDAIYPKSKDPKHFTLKNLLKDNYIQTNSVMYRKIDYNNLSLEVMPFDWYLHLSHVKDGKIGFVNEVMSAYRRHSGGIWWSQHDKPQLIWEKYGYGYLRLLHEIMLLHGSTQENKEIIGSHIAGSFEAIYALENKAIADNLMEKAIVTMPTETWVYIRHLIQQVEHYSKHDAYIQGVLESDAGYYKKEIKNLSEEVQRLSDELDDMATSKAWKVVHLVRQGEHIIRYPLRKSKKILSSLRRK